MEIQNWFFPIINLLEEFSESLTVQADILRVG